MLAEMELPDPERIMAAYPHQLSGGQQQRAVIAMALLPQPRLLLLDEPTTALDVTVEAGIIDLLGELRRTHNTAMLFISHNLGLVGQICERAAVMYAGEIVETGEVHQMFARPRHPYTAGLMRCIPRPDLPRALQCWCRSRARCRRTRNVRSAAASVHAARTFGARPCDSGADPAEARGARRRSRRCDARAARRSHGNATEDGAEPSMQYAR